MTHSGATDPSSSPPRPRRWLPDTGPWQSWLLLVLLGVGGAAMFVGDLFRATVWNQMIPDQLRGRLAGMELLVGAGGPAPGDLRAGLTATGLGLRPSIWVGGLAATSATGLVRAAVPALWHHRAAPGGSAPIRQGNADS